MPSGWSADRWGTEVGVAAAAIACGFGVWIAVQLMETKEITFPIQVRATNVPAEAQLELLDREVTVKLSFPATESNDVQPQNFYVELDFTDIVERIGKKLEDTGDRTISREKVKAEPPVDMLGQNIAVVDILTPEVSWSGRLRYARATVDPQVVGTPAPGYVISGWPSIDETPEVTVLMTAEREDEWIRGGRQVLRIPTDPIDVGGQSAVMRERVKLALPPGFTLLPGESDSRLVALAFSEETRTRTLENVPVEYKPFTAALQATVQPATVKVTLRGKSSAISAVTPALLAFSLFGVAEKPGESREVAIEVRVNDPNLRSGIERVEVEPAKVLVTVTERPSAAEATPSATVTPTPTPVP